MKKLNAGKIMKNEWFPFASHIRSSAYFVFDTPIYESWIASSEIRKRLEDGANARTSLPEEVKAVLLENIHSTSQ